MLLKAVNSNMQSVFLNTDILLGKIGGFGFLTDDNNEFLNFHKVFIRCHKLLVFLDYSAEAQNREIAVVETSVHLSVRLFLVYVPGIMLTWAHVLLFQQLV